MTSALERLKEYPDSLSDRADSMMVSWRGSLVLEMLPELLALWEACDEVHRRGGSIDPYGAFVKEIEALNAKANQVLGEE